MIDELAQLRISDYGTAIYKLLQEIASTARAAGISLVAFTQSSNCRVIDEFIKINLPGRVCFSVPDASSSILFVGDGSATGLMPAGRAIVRHGTLKYMVQTPLITPSDITQIVNNAKLGQLTGKITERGVSPQEIVAWAISENESNLGVRDVYKQFGNRIEQRALIAQLKEMENRIYEIDGESYKVQPSRGSRWPRIVERIATNGDPNGPESRNVTRNANDEG